MELEDGTQLPADLVLVGIGSIPNAGLAEPADMALVDGGIQVDQSGQSSVEDIYAAGDCCAQHNWQTNRIMRIESVQNATDQARTVACKLTGRPLPSPKANWFWSEAADRRHSVWFNRKRLARRSGLGSDVFAELQR